MTTRANYSDIYKSPYQIYLVHSDGSVGPTNEYSLNAMRASESTLGVTRRKPTGFIPPTPYTYSSTVYRPGYGSSSFYSYYHKDTQYGNGCIGGDGFSTNAGSLALFTKFKPIPTLSSLQPLIDNCLVQARLKMKRQDVNLGVAFAERNKTARMVGDTALQLVRAIRSTRKGDFRGAASALGISERGRFRSRSVPERWLQLQYGWKPLLYDVEGACKALENASKESLRVTAKAGVSRDLSSDYFVTESTGYYAIIPIKETCKVGVFVRIDALPGDPSLRALSSLGIANLGTIAWELVPFSFVVDWLLPIGDWIDSFDALLGYTSVTCSVSTIIRRSASFSGSIPTTTVGSGVQQGDLSIRSTPSVRRDVYLVRQVPSGVPLPTLPRFKDPASLGHMANGLSLLATAFRK